MSCITRFIVLCLCLSLSSVGCERPKSGCENLIEIFNLQVENGEARPAFLEAIVRLDGNPWLRTQKSSYPPEAQWSFCAPSITPGEHELRVTLLASAQEGPSYLGAEFNPDMRAPSTVANHTRHGDAVVLRRPKLCNSQGWCWENPWPQGSPLNAVASRDEGSVWATGDAGTILHWNGGFWQRLELATQGTGIGIWVDERDYAWVLVRPDKIYRCGNLGCTQIGAKGGPNFSQLFGFDATHAFAVGTNGSLYACGPMDCQQLNSTVSTDLKSGVAVAADLVYVGGSSGILLRCQGNTCTKLSTGSGAALNFVATDKKGSIHAVGEGGLYIVCSDGSCLPRATGTTAALHKVVALPDGSALLMGVQATVVACDARGCRPLDVPKGLTLSGLYGMAASDAWVSGYQTLSAADGIYRGIMLRCDGTRCQEVYSVPQYNGLLAGLGASDQNNVWAVGYLGVMVQCGAEQGCRARSSGATQTLSTISGDAHLAWASGQNGAVVRCVENFGCTEYSAGTNSWQLGGGGGIGQHWTVGRDGSAAACSARGCQPLSTSTTHMLKSVWPIDQDSVWVAGGAQVVLRCNRHTCTKVMAEQPGNANGIWGTALDNTWIVGGFTSGTVYRCSGSGCNLIHTDSATSEFLAVSGAGTDTAWAVGQQGGITRCTTSACTSIKSGVNSQLAAVWAPTPNSAWAVGAGGIIIACQDTTCRSVVSGTDKYLSSVHGVSTQRFWIVGHNGLVLRCINDRCDPTTMLTPTDLGPVIVPDADSGWMAGGGGAVFRFYPSRMSN